MKIAYERWDPRPATLAIVEEANRIIGEYEAQGYTLTLRQLYYQFVARDLIPNTQRSYKNLGNTLGKARLAGLVSWTAIEDRTRNLVSWVGHEGPRDVLEEAADRFNLEKWERQPVYIEVWIEKEALAGVFRRACSRVEVPFFSCRGYGSLSEMWEASQRLRRKHSDGKGVYILHFGDHDPSGIDMTRDIGDRLETFWTDLEVRRLALNMDQVEEYDPPPNPAKLTDSRVRDYIMMYGHESWELDALEPSVLEGLVRDEVESLRDAELWEEATQEQAEYEDQLNKIVRHLDEVIEYAAEL